MEFSGCGSDMVWLCLVLTRNDALSRGVAVRCFRFLPEWLLERNQVRKVRLFRSIALLPLEFRQEESSQAQKDFVRKRNEIGDQDVQEENGGGEQKQVGESKLVEKIRKRR